MKKLLWIGMAFFIVLVGCDLVSRDFYRAEGEFPEDGKGMLVLILDGNALPTKTIVPPGFSMDMFSYDITGKIGTDTQFSHLGVLDGDLPSGVYTRDGMTPATNWTIEVIAYNAPVPPATEGTQIGQGTSDPFTITKDVFDTPVTVIIEPIDDYGTLNLVFTWPKAFADTPEIQAWLTPAGEVEAVDPNASGDFYVDTGPDPCTATYNRGVHPALVNDLPTGYYTLRLHLTGIDPADPPNYKTVWGDAVSIRIIDGQESVGSLQTASGGANVTITPDLKNPVVITFSNVTFPTSTSIEATASFVEPVAPDPVPDSYKYDWYIDGILDTTVTVSTAPLNFNTQTITVTPGGHNLSVLVTAWVGGELDSISSATYEFTTP